MRISILFASSLLLLVAVGCQSRNRGPTGPIALPDGGTSATSDGGGMFPEGDGGADVASCTNDTWSDWPRSFFSAHCSRCHGSQLASLSVVRANEGAIYSDISSGRMPKDEWLQGADKERILTWLSCGTP